MTENPEEGRLTQEQQAKLLRESRKRTAEMKREYRQLRREDDAKKATERWAANHRKQHQKAYDDLSEVASVSKLNRRERRHFAKRMNVFKSEGGWQYFMNNYRKNFGKQETVVRRKGKATERRTNIEQAMSAANAEKEGK